MEEVDVSEKSFSLFERLYFFYEHEGKPGFEKRILRVKAVLGRRLQGFIRELVSDIGVLLEGQSNVPAKRYARAFHRYMKYYGCSDQQDSFSSQQLYDYCRYLCRTFGVGVPRFRASARRIRPEYRPHPEMEKILARRERTYKEDDDIPF